MAEPDANDPILKAVAPPPDAPPTVFQVGAPDSKSTARTLAALGRSIGWGIAILGVMAAVVALVEPLPAPAMTSNPQIGRVLRAAWLVLAFGLAGWAFFRVLGVASSLVRRAIRRRLGCTPRALEARLSIRLCACRANRGGARAASGNHRSPAGRDFERARAAAEIDAAIRDEQWSLAESLLDAFETAYPGDPKCDRSRTALAAARQSVLQNRMAELAAAERWGTPPACSRLSRRSPPASRRTLASQYNPKWPSGFSL